MTHDVVLVFSKSWGALYLLIFFLVAVAWTYWPSRKSTYTQASQNPLEKDDNPCQ